MQTGMQGNMQFTLPTNALIQHGLACAPTQPAAVRLKTPEAAVEVAHGFGAAIPVKVNRLTGAEGTLSVTALAVPPGVTIPAASIAEKSAEGSVTINTAPEAALGTSTIVLVTKGKIANADRTLTLPAVILNIVRPAALELAAPGVEVKAGTMVELKGRSCAREHSRSK
jgi:hypothetical protein